MPTIKQKPYLNEWIMVHELMNHAECIHLLEERFIEKRLTKLQVIDHILSMLIGFESESFKWNYDEEKFEPSKCYSMTNVNRKSYQMFLSRFSPIGTMYNRMSIFVDTEYFRGKTFFAYQNVLKKILEEIMDKILKLKQHFKSTESECHPDKNIRLILIESFLDCEQNSQILLSIRNLNAIHQEIMMENNQLNDEQLSITNFKTETSLHRHYCRQTLDAIHKRLSIPNKRIRSIAYTMLDNCLRILFISLEKMLNSFHSLSEISSNEFLFESKYHSKIQLFHANCNINEMSTYWHDILFVDKRFKSLPLFQFESLELLAEAIKCTFVCRINKLNNNLNSLNELKRIKIIDLFRSIMNKMLKINCPDFNIDNNNNNNKQFNIDLDSYEIIESSNLLIEYRMKKFQLYQLPINTVLPINLILNDALNETFERISRPIIKEFLPELRRRYIFIFNKYTDFFLCQNVEHILLYMHFLFPTLKEYLQRSRHKRSFNELDSLIKQIHNSYLNNNNNNNNDDGDCENFFQPHLSLTIQTKKFKNNFNNNNNNDNDFDWIIQSFDIFYYIPSSSSNDNNLNFWPLTIMFNSNINDLFNEMFQFLLRLRYFQYLIGNDFLLSSKFRFNDLQKNIYLFRFRLANLIFQFGYQMEYRLKELIQQTLNRFNDNDINNFEEFFIVHQKFLEKLEQIKTKVIQSDFIRQQFRTIAKFCHTNSHSHIQTLTDTTVKNRRQSIVENINKLDNVRSEDFII